MSQNTLKIIAIATMFIDHVGAIILLPLVQQGNFTELYWLSRYIGRMAFPIFAYLIAMGCVHSKNIHAYALRLFAFAIISQIPFALAFGRQISFVSYTNIFYTLFLAVFAVVIYKMLDSKWWAAPLSLIPAAFAAHFLGTDYGAFGVSLIFILYVANPQIRWRAAVLIAAGMVYFYFGQAVALAVFGIAAAICIFLDNGRRKPSPAVAKYTFYAFYPAHLLLLWLIVP